jgi:hypothetical protein
MKACLPAHDAPSDWKFCKYSIKTTFDLNLNKFKFIILFNKLIVNNYIYLINY